MSTPVAASPQVPSSPKVDYLEQAFGDDGYLARGNPAYRRRDGQVELARAAHECFEQAVPTIREGPTGIGKSLAYLVPATRFASRGHVVCVVTATNALAEQLMHVDLPRLAKVLPWKFTYALLVGRSNYLCVEKEAGFAPSLLKPSDLVAAKSLMKFAKITETGLKTDAPAETHGIWSHVSVGPEECKKPSCRVQEFCFAEKARKAAKAANIIVTNMHMLALHLQVGSVLPEFDALVIDEAHELADVCQAFFGEAVSESALRRMLAACMKSGVDAETAEKPLRAVFDAARVMLSHPLDGMFDGGPKKDETGGRTVRFDAVPGADPVVLGAALRKTCASLDAILERDAADRKLYGTSRLDDDTVTSARTARRMADRFVRVLVTTTPGQVRWLEGGPRGDVEIHCEPVTVGAALRSLLFEQYPRCFLASATLTSAGSFAFFRSEVGAPREATAAALPSPFDFSKQALLIVPELPCPDDDPEGWAEGVQELLRYVVKTLDGRTLGLFTAATRMRAAYADLERVEGGRRKVYVQGEGALRSLVEAKKADERSVLLGLASLWTGVDAPGDTLSCVLMDRLPMLVSSPHLDAVKAAMKEEVWRDEKGVEHKGRDFFTNYYFPKSATRLRQGFGRGVRRHDDVCVTILCDSRVYERPYGRIFLDSLPPEMERTRRVEDMVPFLKYARGVVRGASK